MFFSPGTGPIWAVTLNVPVGAAPTLAATAGITSAATPSLSGPLVPGGVHSLFGNALAPAVQVFAQSIQYLVGGIIVVEYLFSYPGIGKELVDAVAIRDVREVQTIAVLIAAFCIFINIVSDLLVVLLVPKLRTANA